MVTTCRAGEVYGVDIGLLDGTGIRQGIIQPVAVLSPRFVNLNRNAVNVVPLLVTRPRTTPLHAVPLEKSYRWANKDRKVWARCDAMQLVAIERLLHLETRSARKIASNVIPIPQLSALDLRRIRIGVVHVIDGQALLKPDIRQEYREHVNAAMRPLRQVAKPKKSSRPPRRRK